MAVSDLCLFITVPWVGLQYVIVVFPGHTHLPLIATHIISKLSTKVFYHSQLGSRNFAQDSKVIKKL